MYILKALGKATVITLGYLALISFLAWVAMWIARLFEMSSSLGGLLLIVGVIFIGSFVIALLETD